jgi:hypothetical protein
MTDFKNLFVSYLNRYTTVSPEHEAAFDEFITQTPPPSGVALRLETKTEEFVHNCFKEEQPPSIILTGNAGDGKTYLCRQVIKGFSGETVTDWGDQTEWSVSRGNQTLRVVKDLSEMGIERGAEVLRALEQVYTRKEETSSEVFLIAANEGRLRALLNREHLEQLYNEIDVQLRDGPDLTNHRLIVLNLNKVTTSAYVLQALAWLTNVKHWDDCQECSLNVTCPIRLNVTRISNPHIASRIKLLYQILEYLDIHTTIRDMLIHLAYTVTGGQTCEAINGQRASLGAETHQLAYYENIWGTHTTETFRRKVAVIDHLHRLDIGGSSLFDIDDFIVNGRPDDPEAQAEYNRLFKPATDLSDRRFAQDRDAYLRGGATSPRQDEEHPFLRWLPHCRRKLFFEWRNVTQANRLVSFLFLQSYLHLLEGDRGAQERAKRELALGLNRAFSRLYVTDSNYLYITTQYAHAVEQPLPIVRVKIPIDYFELTVQHIHPEAYDYDRRDLVLIIPPPPRVDRPPVEWPVDLLRFEYLMRLAQGGTYNVLADECELAIRQLKNELLTRFAMESEEKGHITFFVPRGNRYVLRDLWLNDEGKIQE